MFIEGTSSLHADTFAKALGWEVGTSPTQGWLILCGVSPKDADLVKALRASGHKVAAYWIGSDSLCAVQDPRYRAAIPEFDKHLVVHERLQRELKAWGVASEVCWPCARNFRVDHTAPERPMVGVYEPTPGPHDIYYFDLCCQIARENTEIQFLFYGATGYPVLPDNVVDGGRFGDGDDLYSRMSVLLRLVSHDGFAVGAMEARIRGIKVITNFPYESLLFADTVEKVNELLNSPETHKVDTGPGPAWYRQECCPEAFKERIWKRLQLPPE